MNDTRSQADITLVQRSVLAATVWLIALPLALGALRLVLPSDGLLTSAPGEAFTGRGHLLEASPHHGIEVGDVLVAIDGRSVPAMIASPQSSPVQVGDVHRYTVERAGVAREIEVEVQRFGDTRQRLRLSAAGTGLGVAIAALGAWLVARRPTELAAYALLLFGAGIVNSGLLPLHWPEPIDLAARPDLVPWSFAAAGGFIQMGLAILLFALWFPTHSALATGRLVAALTAAPVLGTALLGVAFRTGTTSLPALAAADTAVGATVLSVIALAVGVAAVRWRRVRADPFRRRQVEVVVTSFIVVFGTSVVASLLPTPPPSWVLVPLVMVFPLSIVVAVTTRNLFDLEITLNRTAVLVVCSAVLLGVYLAVFSVAAHLASRTNALTALPAAGLVAVCAAPLRTRVQTLLNRRLFGTGSDPSFVFHQLGLRLAAADDPESLTTAILTTATESLRLPYAAIEVDTAMGWQVVDQRGRARDETVAFEMATGEETVARLIVSPRRDTPLSPTDRELLADLARHSGMAARLVLLVAELHSAQQQLLAAREAERHRIHRDLHDGLAPTLVGLTLQLEVLAEVTAGQPDVGPHVARLHHTAATATDDVRRLVRDLRPGELDELGLSAALTAAVSRLGGTSGPRFEIHAPLRLPSLSSETEDAAYKICLEAITNAVRHSQARHCTISMNLDTNQQLAIEVLDDGVGLPDGHNEGTGLASMRQRASALGGSLSVAPEPGGGTKVDARLPLASSQP
jgi:two-component system NarL family sensor kinase